VRPSRRLLLPGCLLAAVLVPAGCGREPRAPGAAAAGAAAPDVVAAFRDGVVRRSEFDAFERPPKPQDIQIQEVEEKDWRVSNITEIVVHKVLEADVPADDPTLPPAILQSTNAILVETMKQELGWNDLSATPQELRAYYDANRERYADPKTARAEHIFLRAEDAEVEPLARQEVRERLEEIRREILNGADFTEMIRMHSQSDDADRGGVMTLKADARVFPAFADAVWALEVDEVSEVIDIPTGFQLVKMKEILPPVQREFDAVVEFVRRTVLEEKLAEAHAAFLREAGERHGLEKRYERLTDPHIAADEPLIVVGDLAYRFQDLQIELPQTLRSHLYGAYFPEVWEFLDEIAVNILLVKEAARLEVEKREDVAARIDAGIRAIRSQRGLDQRLQAKAAEVGDDDLREFFQQNEMRFQTLQRVDLDVLLVKHEEKEPFWATLRRAEELAARIRAGEDFAELARAHSAHYSASNGGRLEGLTDMEVGEFVHGRPAFRAQLKALGEGKVSDPMVAECYDTKKLMYIRTGVLIARVVKEYPAEQASFEDVEELVRANYLRRNYQAFEAEVRQEILDSAAVEIYFDKLPPI
jgi:parvulin-like peptidyl-prolyl isomerase